MTTQAESLRAALRAIHYQTEGLRRRHDDGFITDWECDACGTAWPCETEAALAATPPTEELCVCGTGSVSEHADAIAAMEETIP